ncbi:hypothetical protein [Sporomusa sphaeroides]|uniref:hypothetical protein n=1 Tax=Sporomusa sphaeroides TaxID=47679 RepID=UPI002CE42B7C|nr:hypothetical protein [Sporomusa sphaeroides]HML31960.1 hypothetical protein [Sporomusa sphaeroides]
MQDIYQAIQEKRAVKHPGDPYLKRLVGVKSKHLEMAENRWKIIQEIVECEPDVYNPELKAAMVRDCLEKHKIGRTAVYEYIRLYWVGGKTKEGLIPDLPKCGAPGKNKPDTCVKRGYPVGKKRGKKRNGSSQSTSEIISGINVTEEIRGIIQAAIDMFYYPNRNMNPAQVWHQMNATFFSQGVYLQDGVEVPKLMSKEERPKYPQFYYWFNKLVDPVKAKKEQEGKLAYEIKYRTHKGNANQLTMGPGFLYAVDWSMGDIYLVNKITRTKVMQRPIVYVCMDIFSRFITGLWITLERASWMTAAMVVENVVEDKLSFCKKYGITIAPEEWPTNCLLPRGFLADRGEFYCYNSDKIISGLGSKVDNTSPYRADCKGVVEQMFNRFNIKAIHLLPGMVPRKPVRWEPDHRLNATLDIDQFTKLMIKAALYYNLYHEIENYPYDRFMLSTQVRAIPIDLWNWGIAFRGGHFLDVDPVKVKECLYPKAKAKITRRGIEFKKKLIYRCDEEKINKKILHASIVGEEPVDVMFDPRTTKYVWIIGSSAHPILCTLVQDSSYNDLSFEDFESLYDERKLGWDLRIDEQEQKLIELHATEEAVVKEAEELTKTALLSKGLKKPTIKNMKENTAVEIERMRDERLALESKPDKGQLLDQREDKDIPERQEDRFLKLLRGEK